MNLESLISTAIKMDASDIHMLLMHDNTIQLRYRVYGGLIPSETVSDGMTLINRIKICSELNVAESRRTQEGQFSFVFENETYFIRVSIVNSEKGEKLALRILSPLKKLPLHQLGLSKSQEQNLVRCITQKSGLILVCGATGSGKTTTLYSCLNEVNNGTRTIFTIEDPIEFPIDGIYQFEPNEMLEIDTFALLKSFLRQDPDIIMVGEIRDAKTADLAISAALTGHLVLATIHTSSALNVIHRCNHWHVDFFSLVSTLSLIIHQNMTYNEAGGKPIFSMLVPAWSDYLPKSYQSVIEQVDLWQSIRGDL